MRRFIAACSAIVLTAGPSVAATFATSFIDATVTVAPTAPVGDVFLDPFPTAPRTIAANPVTDGVGQGNGEAVESASGEALAASAQTTSAAAGNGFAFTFVEGLSTLFIENASATETVTFDLGLTYSALAEVTSDGFADDFAFAGFGLLFEDFEGGVASFEIEQEVGIGDAAIELDDVFVSLGSLTLGPGAVADLSLSAISDTGADSLGVVPLPAALPMLLAGLGALVALRRRA